MTRIDADNILRYTKEDIEEYKIYPNYIFSDIRELCNKLKEEI